MFPRFHGQIIPHLRPDHTAAWCARLKAWKVKTHSHRFLWGAAASLKIMSDLGLPDRHLSSEIRRRGRAGLKGPVAMNSSLDHTKILFRNSSLISCIMLSTWIMNKLIINQVPNPKRYREFWLKVQFNFWAFAGSAICVFMLSLTCSLMIIHKISDILWNCLNVSIFST